MLPSGTALRLMVGIGLVVVVTQARAQGRVEVVGQFLALAGLLGGALGGAVAGYRVARPLVFWHVFLVYLGCIAMLASTRAGSMEIVPLAIVLAALIGIGPFAAAYHLARYLVQRARARRGQGSRSTGGNHRQG